MHGLGPNLGHSLTGFYAPKGDDVVLGLGGSIVVVVTDHMMWQIHHQERICGLSIDFLVKTKVSDRFEETLVPKNWKTFGERNLLVDEVTQWLDILANLGETWFGDEDVFLGHTMNPYIHGVFDGNLIDLRPSWTFPRVYALIYS